MKNPATWLDDGGWKDEPPQNPSAIVSSRNAEAARAFVEGFSPRTPGNVESGRRFIERMEERARRESGLDTTKDRS